ncbi:MAG: hypothetical protein DI536_30435 [Archangium gephyra]|uniref:Alpha/beta hydrolase n=1 Tax=Archangium gephyra TaxID=48 RepID=A0A2W5SU50_9BACT|nr:MAG: hypothetical protein DI536_30435 [Archangium gephyra]
MTTVLFIHGLESGPRGHKARALADAGFEVVAVQMPSSRSAILKDPVTQLALLSALVVLISAAFAGLVWFAATLVLLALSATPFRVAVTRRMWRRSVDVQRAALRSHAIDVVLGSSFGGAVALELLARGDWKGRTVLLCPAHRLVAQRARIAPSRLPEQADVLVVHGTRDETVPLTHSRALVENTAAKLIEVDDTHRLFDTATADNLKAWINAR